MSIGKTETHTDVVSIQTPSVAKGQDLQQRLIEMDVRTMVMTSCIEPRIRSKRLWFRHFQGLKGWRPRYSITAV